MWDKQIWCSMLLSLEESAVTIEKKVGEGWKVEYMYGIEGEGMFVLMSKFIKVAEKSMCLKEFELEKGLSN